MVNSHAMAGLNKSQQRSGPPLLLTESAEEFSSFCAELEREIKPRGIIEQIYVEELPPLPGTSVACVGRKPGL
jgi:hypothetical protein